MVKMIKKKALMFFLVLLLMVTVVVARNALVQSGVSRYEAERNIIGFLNDDNVWSGENSFLNFTWINYDVLNVTGAVNASEFCIGDDCVSSWEDLNSTEDFVPYVGALYDVELGDKDLNASILRTQRSVGGIVYLERESNSQVIDGNLLGQIAFWGRETDAGEMAVGAQILAKGDSTWNTGSVHPSRLEFYTEDDTGGSGMAFPKLTITSDGEVWITRDYDSLVFGSDKDIIEEFDGTDRYSIAIVDSTGYYFINYSNVNFSGHVNATDYYGSGAFLSELNVTGNISAGGDINALGYTISANFLEGIVGLLEMRGDPWWLSGVDLQIDQDLLVDGNTTSTIFCLNGSLLMLGVILVIVVIM